MKLLLKNGLVYDGSNQIPKNLDLLIENDKITKLATNMIESDARVIDCTGLCIAPGFIDAHSHNDFFIDKDNTEESILPFLKQGITTQVVGNCGFSAYGVDPNSQYANLVGGNLFKTNHPTSLSEFRNGLENKLMVNIVPLTGHGTTRISVSGYKNKKLTKEELTKQLALLEASLKEGAFGGSLGLMYEPGIYTPTEELIEFAKVIKRYDGILTIHARASSKVAMGYSLLGKPHIERALDEIIDIIKKTKVRCEYSHLIFVGKSSWACCDRMLDKIKEVNSKGFELGFDLYPFTYGASIITVILPGWYMKLNKTERQKPLNKIKLKLIINMTKKLLGIDFDDLVVSYISEDHPEYEGKSVAEAAKDEKMKPLDMYLKLVDLSEGKGRIMLGKYYNEDIILKLMQDSYSVFMTDAWYEESGTQNAGTYQAFPFFLEKSRNHNLELHSIIYKMTGLTADRFKIKNRGYIKEGYTADITIFKYEEINIDKNDATKTSSGIKYVIVNGEVTMDNNEYTGIKKGVFLSKI